MDSFKEAVMFGIGAKLVPEVIESVIALGIGAVVLSICWILQNGKRG